MVYMELKGVMTVMSGHGEGEKNWKQVILVEKSDFLALFQLVNIGWICSSKRYVWVSTDILHELIPDLFSATDIFFLFGLNQQNSLFLFKLRNYVAS